MTRGCTVSGVVDLRLSYYGLTHLILIAAHHLRLLLLSLQVKVGIEVRAHIVARCTHCGAESGHLQPAVVGGAIGDATNSVPGLTALRSDKLRGHRQYRCLGRAAERAVGDIGAACAS